MEDMDGYRKIIREFSSRSSIRRWLLSKDKFIGKITLYLQVLIEKTPQIEQELYHKELQKKNVSTLLGDFAALRKNGLMADVNIVLEGRQFPAHKTVLSARSDLFAAMFGHTDTLESQKGEVLVKDVNKVTMENFLTFLYEATLPKDLDFDGYVELLKVADKYQVASLIELCATKLRENIGNPGNAVKGAILGSVYRIAELKNLAIKAIVGSETPLSSMEGYQELLEHPTLLIEMLDYPKSKKRKMITPGEKEK